MGRKFSEAECAYIAGLLDGDGAIMARIERHAEKKYGFRVRVTLRISQSRPEILHWINSVLAAGYLRKNRNAYDWQVQDQADVLSILKSLQKHIRVKKKQTDLAIKILQTKIISGKDLIIVARLADTLSSFNVRSKNRGKNYTIMVKESIPRND